MPDPQDPHLPTVSQPTKPMQFIVFTDLDDTLFTSLRKAPPGGSHQPVAFLRDGAPISYASPVQQAWFAHWQAHALVIPVTARNLDAYRRVSLDFRHHAIINYGGLILNPDGSLDAAWQEHSAGQARSSQARLTALAADAARFGEDLHIRLIEDQGICFYLLIKSRSGAPLDAAAAHLAAQLRPGEQLHHNANNLALLPPWLDKAHAVARVLALYRQQYGSILSIGMGDSRIDLAFMRQCDFLLAPQHSQIAAGLP